MKILTMTAAMNAPAMETIIIQILRQVKWSVLVTIVLIMGGMTMIELQSCPVCRNAEPKVNSCIFEGKTYAYNVFCPVCGFTDRSYKMVVKALKKWNALVEQTKHIRSQNE